MFLTNSCYSIIVISICSSDSQFNHTNEVIVNVVSDSEKINNMLFVMGSVILLGILVLFFLDSVLLLKLIILIEKRRKNGEEYNSITIDRFLFIMGRKTSSKMTKVEIRRYIIHNSIVFSLLVLSFVCGGLSLKVLPLRDCAILYVAIGFAYEAVLLFTGKLIP